MIGVIANSVDREVVAEFFELFKTSWEFYSPGHAYDAIVCDGCRLESEVSSNVILVYGSQAANDGESTDVGSIGDCCQMEWNSEMLPIYRGARSFLNASHSLIQEAGTGRCAGYRTRHGSGWYIRVGYSLFAEVRHMLTEGQPEANGRIPTLDLHIDFLRQQLLVAGVRFTEIPPVPLGYKFIACLTHDVDHPSIRLHRFDHTAFGFLFRAVFGSVRDFFRGRASSSALWQNWVASAKLPFVYAGVATDFWRDLGRYPQMERGASSTFFVIPRAGYPGMHPSGRAPEARASGYGVGDIADEVRKLQELGCEIGLHGLDAWCDSGKGREELDEVGKVAGDRPLGVRMHWLYWDENSPAKLEASGAAYDSTVGYNGEVGYRVGTAQAYKPLNAKRLLELPLIIMDTALFYPSRLHLTRAAAKERVAEIIANAKRHGGCVTVNWHDRSIAPERLWSDFYGELIEELWRHDAWIASSAEVIEWFRLRRSFSAESAPSNGDSPAAHGTTSEPTPKLQFREFNQKVSTAEATVIA